MSQLLDDAKSEFLKPDKPNFDLAVSLCEQVISSSHSTPGEKADAMFLLGQISRFFEPWRTNDDGASWFVRAVDTQPDHLDSILALCELALEQANRKKLESRKWLSRLRELRPQASNTFGKQIAEIDRAASDLGLHPP